MQQKQLTEQVFSRKETAEILGVTLQTLNNWRREGVLVPSKIGSKVYYRESDIQTALNKDRR